MVDGSPAGEAEQNIPANWRELLTKIELFDDALVSIGSGSFEVIEQLSTAGHHLQQSASGRVIFQMALEVVGQLINPLRQKRYLHIRTPCIFLVHSQGVNILSVCHIFFEGGEYAARSPVGK
jgi:hypothetical protein